MLPNFYNYSWWPNCFQGHLSVMRFSRHALSPSFTPSPVLILQSSSEFMRFNSSLQFPCTRLLKCGYWSVFTKADQIRVSESLLVLESGLCIWRITKWSITLTLFTGSWWAAAALHLLGNFVWWLIWCGCFCSRSQSGSSFHSFGTYQKWSKKH